MLALREKWGGGDLLGNEKAFLVPFPVELQSTIAPPPRTRVNRNASYVLDGNNISPFLTGFKQPWKRTI